MIIDTHAQLYTKEAVEGRIQDVDADLQAMYRGYSGFFSGRGMEKHTLEDMDAAGVDMSVIVGVDAETTKGFRIPNELVAAMQKQYPDRLIGFAGVDPHKGDAALRDLDAAIGDMGLRGLKFIPHLLELNPNDKLMYPLYEKAAEYGVPVLLHTGTHFHAGCKIKYCKPEFVDEIAVDFPKVNFIMAHFGFPWYQEAMAVAQRNFNVYFNIAGWAPKYIPEMVVTYMNTVLAGKVLFGSDHPLLPRKRLVDELAELPLQDASRQSLLSGNAVRLLKIKT